MDQTTDLWAFVIALAAVVNGLGIVQLLGALSSYLKKSSTLEIQHYWVHTVLFVFQLLAHMLLWWSILGLKAANNINFLSYLYLLVGPTMLYLSTSLIVPEIKDKAIDFRSEYYGFRKTYFTILSIFWLWAIFVWPVFGHGFAPTVPLISIWLLISLTLRFTGHPGINATLVVANCGIYAAFVTIYAMKLGEVGARMMN